MSGLSNIHALFAPSAVAVIGASAEAGKIGHIIVANLVSSGYAGKILPVNPGGGAICGLPVVTDVSLLPTDLDLAVISLPPRKVLSSVKTLASLKTRAVAVISAGFREAGPEGFRMEAELAQVARDAGMALIGPNCLGVMSSQPPLDATFSPDRVLPGTIAFFSQSGALCISILDWAKGRGIGFSKFVSLGNMAVLDESDMLGYLANDPDTSVILGYIEGVSDGASFLAQAKLAAAKKPVIVLKSGITATGARAATSHTGALAGTDAAFEAACKQAGVIRARSPQSLFSLAQAFACDRLPAGPNLAVVTNSGGPGILAADACEQSGLVMTAIRGETVTRLKEILPPFASLYNPIDIIGDADAARYAATLSAVLADPSVHSLLVILTTTPRVDPAATAEAVAALARDTDKPVFCCFMGEARVAEANAILRAANIPVFPFPDTAVECLAALHRHQLRRSSPPPALVCYRRDKPWAEKIIKDNLAKGVFELVEAEASGIMRAYEMPAPQTIFARTSKEAGKAAERIGFPVAVKIVSPQISHKTDVGGVALNLGNAAAVRQAFMEVTARAQRAREDAHILGCLVQAMAPKGSKEIIVGLVRDPQFGPMVMFGLGGVHVEVLRDISFRLAPLSLSDAQEMVREIRGFPLLRGVRGEPAVDLKAIEDVLLMVSQMAVDFPQIAEADFNPVMAGPKGVVVADARIALCAVAKC